MPEPIVRLEGIRLRAADGRPVFEDLDLELPVGGRAVLCGDSGSGKTPLLKLIAGLVEPEAGTARLGGAQLWPGKGLAALGGKLRIGFAFSKGGLISNLSLRDNLLLPPLFVTDDPRPALEAQVDGLLERLGLAPFARLRPHALSARSRKLANLGRAGLLNPKLLLLDEPLADLDDDDMPLAWELLGGWAEDPERSILVAAERPEVFKLLGPRVLELDHGKIRPQEAP